MKNAWNPRVSKHATCAKCGKFILWIEDMRGWASHGEARGDMTCGRDRFTGGKLHIELSGTAVPAFDDDGYPLPPRAVRVEA